MGFLLNYNLIQGTYANGAAVKAALIAKGASITESTDKYQVLTSLATYYLLNTSGAAVADRADAAKTKLLYLFGSAMAGAKGQLFGVSEKDLLDHVHSFDGGGFKTKDFRTLVGTKSAQASLANRDAPKDAKAYKKAVKEVATEVSQVLGNTPSVALASYINPAVFAPWRAAAGV